MGGFKGGLVEGKKALVTDDGIVLICVPTS